MEQNMQIFAEMEALVEKYQVVVKHTDINKGIFTQLLIQHRWQNSGKIDFIVVFGNTDSDEDMFYQIKKLKNKFGKYMRDDVKIYLV